MSIAGYFATGFFLIVQMSRYTLGQRLSDKRRYVLHRSSSYSCHASEMQQKPLLGLLPHTLYAFQSGLHLSLAAQFPVKCDAETVRLVTDMLEYLERR